MKKQLLALALAALTALAGCSAPAAAESPGLQRYEASFLTLFDTVTTIVGYADSEETFRAEAQALHDGTCWSTTSSSTSTMTTPE